MKVYLDCPPGLGQGIHRVVRELKAHVPPGVEAVVTRDEADHVVHHIVGVQNFSEVRIDHLVAADNAAGRQHSVVQYCVSTTEASDPAWWAPIWDSAVAVWSYYDLPTDRLYHAPLGASAAFQAASAPVAKTFLVGTSGYVAETEAVHIWARVCREAGAMQFHLGPWLSCFQGSTVIYARDLTDAELAEEWRRCVYVNGLRAIEGFELPAAEGLCCGARPVLFARPEHEHWFADHACYLDEAAPIVAQVQALAAHVEELGPVSEAERAWARERFDWARICGGFWDRIVAG